MSPLYIPIILAIIVCVFILVVGLATKKKTLIFIGTPPYLHNFPKSMKHVILSMKPFIAVFIVLCSLSTQAFAKAYFQTKQEMIEKAEAIAIIEISAVRDSDAKGKVWNYRTRGTAKVEETLKGELLKEFTIHGAETFICASCPVTNGRFIAFLKKDGNLWTGSNWHLSLRPIKDGMVEWYVADDNRYQMKPTALNTVLAEIKTQKTKPKK